MRAAPPEALTVDVRPVMMFRMSDSDVSRLFPVQFQDVDPFAAPEPTRAALVRLNSGRLALVEFGKVTSSVTISVPQGASVGETLADLRREAPIAEDAITWVAEEAATSAKH